MFKNKPYSPDKTIFHPMRSFIHDEQVLILDGQGRAEVISLSNTLDTAENILSPDSTWRLASQFFLMSSIIHTTLVDLLRVKVLDCVNNDYNYENVHSSRCFLSTDVNN